MYLVGNVNDKDIIIFDDIADTCQTIMQASFILKKNGARKITIAITHPILSGPALENLSKSPIDVLFVSNTIPIKNNHINFLKTRSNIKIIQVDVSKIFAASIARIKE